MNDPRPHQEIATRDADLNPRPAPPEPRPKQSLALTPTTIAEAIEFANLLSKSSLVPKEFQGNAGNIIVAIQWGAELGLAPMQSMQSIAVINGRPSIWGDTPLALVRASGLLDSIHEDIREDGATCTVKRRGALPISRTFTMEDARRAKLAGKEGSTWQTYPKRMMQLRARAFALRDEFTDVLRGIQIGEELIGHEIDITPGAPAAAEQLAGPAKTPTQQQADRPYPQGDFDRNLPAWQALIERGKRSVDEIIQVAQAKGMLSDGQKATLRAFARAEAPTDAGAGPQQEGAQA